jgi:hypothetical protein
MTWFETADIYELPARTEPPRNDQRRAERTIAGHAREKAAEAAGYRPTKATDIPISYDGLTDEYLVSSAAFDYRRSSSRWTDCHPATGPSRCCCRRPFTWSRCVPSGLLERL